MRFVALVAAVLVALVSPASARGVSTKCLPAQVKSALAHVAANYGRVQAISAHRPGARIAGTRRRSKHASCQAVDFHVRGNRAGALAWLRRQPLEIITYSGGMHHIHIATGNYRGHHVVNGRGVKRYAKRGRDGKRRTRTAHKAPAKVWRMNWR